MTEQEITEQLIAIHAAYVERTGQQPYMAPVVSLSASRHVRAWFYGRVSDNKISATAESFSGALQALAESVRDIPSIEDRARRDAAVAVAKAIEACRSAGFGADFINPLMQAAKSISENALTHEAAE